MRPFSLLLHFPPLDPVPSLREFQISQADFLKFRSLDRPGDEE